MEELAAVEATDDEEVRVTLIKSDTMEVISEGQADTSKTDPWEKQSIIVPTLHPDSLLKVFSESDALRPNIDTLAQNVAGHGWTLTPRIDFNAENAKDEVASALYLEDRAKFRHELAEANTDAQRAALKPPTFPDDDRVEETLKRWQQEARLERIETEIWLSSLVIEDPLSEHVRITIVDREALGWTGWEVIRNSARRVVRLKMVEGRSLRLGPLTEKPVTVMILRPVSKVAYQAKPVQMHFRTIVQLVGTEFIWFKWLGDPRTISSKTGQAFESPEALKKQEGKEVAPATEIWWHSIPFPNDPYGMVRWHGMIPGLQGSRIAQDQTVIDLASSSIPRGLLLAMDTRIGQSTIKQLKSFFNSKRGKAHNRIAIIEAQTSKASVMAGTGRVALEWVSLVEAQHKDAQFQWYVERTEIAVGVQFRIPKLLTGRLEDFNRGTSQAALEYAEEQVFVPERFSVSWDMTHKLLIPHGVRFWEFFLKGPAKPDRESVAKAADIFLKHGAMTPAEARPLVERTLNVDLFDTPQPWQNQPTSFTLAGVDTQKTREAEQEQGETPVDGVAETAEKMLILYGDITDADATALAKELKATVRDEGNSILLDGSLAEEVFNRES